MERQSYMNSDICSKSIQFIGSSDNRDIYKLFNIIDNWIEELSKS